MKKMVLVANEIYYTGIGSNFRTHFTEMEFREIIKNNFRHFGVSSQLGSYLSIFLDPMNCDLDMMIEFTGAIKIN